jgi:hypothetical protein
MLIGSGDDDAWTLTSADGDTIHTDAEDCAAARARLGLMPVASGRQAPTSRWTATDAASGRLADGDAPGDAVRAVAARASVAGLGE